MKNNQKRGKVVEIKPHHFKDKKRTSWFDFFNMYTHNYIQEGDLGPEKLRKQ